MSPEELGSALSQARIARGLSLHDVERDTRISRSYLQALEQGKLDVLPAPVYARAFTRTYAQYLGLNAKVLVQHLPGAKPEPELPPLPDLRREIGAPLLSPSWLIGGAVIVVLLIMGVVVFWNRGGDESRTVTNDQPGLQTAGGQGGSDATPPAGQPTPDIVVQPGEVPELEGQNLLAAMGTLSEAGIPYFVIQVEREGVEPGVVFYQSPTAASPVEADTIVTLMAGR